MAQYMALYRKYRPAVFRDVVGQEHITKVLQSEIMQGTASHAYLFCGSRGTGKTTCAKILAKAVSCENPQNGDPCCECEKCRAFDKSFDIVEMDAASNNGVDDVRELREKINFLPIEMKKRVYIIDEVHMLSTGAFNALLKTLEEPPEHVMFILATTELNKIPATILSRCKRFDFRRISSEDITARLKSIAEKENIGIDQDALKLIATLATGAMRDALSMLELFVGAKDVDRREAEKILGVVGNETVLEILRHVADKNAKEALCVIAKAYEASKDMSVLCSELSDRFRDLLVMKYASGSVSMLLDETDDVISTLRDIEEKFTAERLLYCTEIVENAVNTLSKSGLSRRAVLELALMRLCDSRLSTDPSSLLERISALENRPASALPVSSPVQKNEKSDEPKNEPIPDDDVPPFDFDDIPPEPYDAPASPKLPTPLGAPERKKQALAEPYASYGDEMMAYGDILEEVKAKNMILYSVITDSVGYLNNDTVTIKLNPMGLFMVNSDESMKNTLTECASKILGYSVKLSLVENTGEKTDKKDDLSMF